MIKINVYNLVMKTKNIKDTLLIFILCLTVFVLVLTIMFLPQRLNLEKIKKIPEGFKSILVVDWINSISFLFQPTIILCSIITIVSVLGLGLQHWMNRYIKTDNISYRLIELCSIITIIGAALWYWQKKDERHWYVYCALIGSIFMFISLFSIRRIINYEELIKNQTFSEYEQQDSIK